MAGTKTSTRKKKSSAPKSGAGKSQRSGQDESSKTIEGSAEEVRKKSQTSPLEFFQQVRSEGEKVTWTGRNETFVSTIMVLIMVAIMSLFFFVVDWTLRTGICALLPGNCAAGV